MDREDLRGPEGPLQAGSRRIVLIALLAPSLLLPSMGFIARGGFLLGGADGATEHPLSWQMYSLLRGPQAVGITRSGGQRSLDPENVTGPIKARVSYNDDVAERLCAASPDLVAVRWGAEELRCGR